MTNIHKETIIYAPISICFDLSRSIDLYSLAANNERAVEGRKSGLIVKGDSVTWRAKHFGIVHQMTVELSDVIKPYFFADRMIHGPFKYMIHTHVFQQFGKATVMRDDFEYKLPCSWLGKVVDRMLIRGYMTKLLEHRNRVIKMLAESGEWKNFLTTFNLQNV